jgi:hypothetical protein
MGFLWYGASMPRDNKDHGALIRPIKCVNFPPCCCSPAHYSITNLLEFPYLFRAFLFHIPLIFHCNEPFFSLSNGGFSETAFLFVCPQYSNS